MKQSIFDKLNLRPNERRIVIVILIIVFIVLNWVFIWPEFGEWKKLTARRQAAEQLKHQYGREIGNLPNYQAQLRNLEQQGATVTEEKQALQLSTTVQNQAGLSGVGVNRYDPMKQSLSSSGGRTNQFFEEQSGVINVTTEEKNLVDFLYNLGAGGSFIRVRSMTLNPDPQRQKLQGNITLVATYQRKAPPKATAPAAKPPPSTGARAASPFRSNAPVQNTQPVKK